MRTINNSFIYCQATHSSRY